MKRLLVLALLAALLAGGAAFTRFVHESKPAIVQQVDSHIPQSGDVSARCYGIGQIDVKILRGERIATIAAAYGARRADIERGFEAPFNDVDRQVGLDRWYTIKAKPGTERRLVREYAGDPRVEYVQLKPGDSSSFGDYIAPDPCENLRYEHP